MEWAHLFLWCNETLLVSSRCVCFTLCLHQKAFSKRKWGQKLHLQGGIYKDISIWTWTYAWVKYQIECFELAEHFRKKINDDDVLEVTGLNCGHTCIETDIPNAVSSSALWQRVEQPESGKILDWVFRILEIFGIFHFDSWVYHAKKPGSCQPLWKKYIL